VVLHQQTRGRVVASTAQSATEGHRTQQRTPLAHVYLTKHAKDELPVARRAAFARNGRENALNRQSLLDHGSVSGALNVVAYFGPAIDDPAVGRRALQWAHAGFDVLLVAFRRNVLARDAHEHFIDLGRLLPRSRAGRIVPLLRAASRIFRHRKALARASLFIGRSPDNALLALFARRICRSKAPFVYEILDVNSSCTQPGFRGAALRRLEKWILCRAHLLVVSSPLFLQHYYQKVLGYTGDWFLFENKVPRFVYANQPRQRLVSERADRERAAAALGHRRWRIGWFGYLDDQASWEILQRLAQSLPEKVAIYVRGAPNAGFDMDRFRADVGRLGNVTYGGPYRNPEDLAEIYHSIDLVWSVDCVAPDSNSRWLFTNALYEAGYFGKPLLGIAGNAVGQFAQSRDIGWCIDTPVAEKLVNFIDRLSVEAYEAKCRVIETECDEMFTETDETYRLWSTVQAIKDPAPRYDALAVARERSEGSASSSPRKVLFIGLFPPPVDGQRIMTQSVCERITNVVTAVEHYDVDRRFPWLNQQLSKLISAIGACFAIVRGRLRGYSALYLAPHSGGLLLLSCLIGLVGRSCGYVFAVHYHSYLNMSRRSRLMAAFVTICGPKAIHVVLAPPMARDLRHNYHSVKRVAVLSNCGFVEPHSSIDRQFNGRVLRIGHLSNLSTEKGLNAVFACVRALRGRGVGVELWLAGPAENQDTEEMIRAGKAELGAHLVYFGRLDPVEVRRFYRSIDIFLFPTAYRHEAEPLVIIDAIASGVPVIATDRGCIDYLLQSSGGRALQLEDFIEKATEQIALWAECPDRLAEASHLARARFLQLRAESQLRFDQLVDALIQNRSEYDAESCN
jgi:glycosyltransferase involved in cell wall biosynthesis